MIIHDYRYLGRWKKLALITELFCTYMEPLCDVSRGKTGEADTGKRDFVNDVPLNESNAAIRVNFIEYWEIGANRVQHFSWVTDLRVSQRNVYHLMRGGRARWKIENETFNTLKNQGYNFEHNYGHGTQNLSVVFAVMMMLAFLVDQTQQLCCALSRAVWTKLGSKRLLWERMRALFYDYRVDSMRALFEALWYGVEKSRPILNIDTS